jgi:hypothetical protein
MVFFKHFFVINLSHVYIFVSTQTRIIHICSHQVTTKSCVTLLQFATSHYKSLQVAID